jgi:hypothetical protein
MPADLDKNGSEAKTLLLGLMLSEGRGAPIADDNRKHLTSSFH